MLPLEIEGKVTRHVGRGTFVSNSHEEQRAVSTGPVDASPAELLDACLTCYPHMTELAVATATAADLRAIEQCVQLLRHTTTIAEYGERDAAFHQAIADATHNALLIEIARTIGRARERIDWRELPLHEGTPRGHEEILEALVKRNGKLARERTKAHLLDARRSLLGGTNRVGQTLQIRTWLKSDIAESERKVIKVRPNEPQCICIDSPGFYLPRIYRC